MTLKVGITNPSKYPCTDRQKTRHDVRLTRSNRIQHARYRIMPQPTASDKAHYDKKEPRTGQSHVCSEVLPNFPGKQRFQDPFRRVDLETCRITSPLPSPERGKYGFHKLNNKLISWCQAPIPLLPVPYRARSEARIVFTS